jgi:hypothetical protein
MTSIIKYKKHVSVEVTRELRLPEGENNQRIGQELATIGEFTYVSLPEGATLPTDQPDEISASIETVTPDQNLRDQICNASPLVKFIRSQVADQIAQRYSMADEIKLLRTAPSEEFDRYNAWAEECRAWGRAEKAKLGL